MSEHPSLESYRQRVLAFEEIQSHAGRVAEMLAFVADGLSHDPEELDLSSTASPDIDGPLLVKASWPTFDELMTMKQQWREARTALRLAWASLSEAERDCLEPCPDVPRSGVLLPFV